MIKNMSPFLNTLLLIGIAQAAVLKSDDVVFSCDFENVTCGMVNQVGMKAKWTQTYLEVGGRKGGVMSVSPKTPGGAMAQIARMVSPYFETHRRTEEGCLSFDFFLSGEGTDKFQLEEQTDNGFQKLLSVHTKLPHWRKADLPVEVPDSVRFVFEAYVNPGLGSAVVAVDNILFKIGNCHP